MKRNALLYLQNIVEAANLIEKYISRQTKVKFEKDTKLQDAVIRRIEIIGEAVKNIPDSIREKYPSIPWRQIAGMRDILSHAYLEVKIDRVWKIVKEDLPKLKKEIQNIIDTDAENVLLRG